MQTLDLYVEDRAGIHIDAIVLLDVFGQTQLVLILDVHEFLLSLLVIRIDLQPAHLGQIRDPLVADMGCNPVCKERVAMKKESSLGNAVRLVVELLREHLVEVAQLLVLQNLGVQSCHAVYGVACHDGQMCHLHLAVIDDGHLRDLGLVARIFCLNSQDEPAVDLLDDLVYTRKQAGEQLDRPFFQCLGHDGMVGVGHGLCGHFPCLVPLQLLLVQQDTHQLGNCYGGMGIVHLEGVLLIELADIGVFSLVTGDRLLHAGGDEEILLLQTQLFAGVMVVIRIQHLYQVAGKVFLLHGFLIIALIEGIELEVIDRFRIPHAQGIYQIVVVADDRNVVGYGTHAAIAVLHEVVAAGLLIIIHAHVSAEFDLVGQLRAAQLKRIAVLEPVVRYLDLIAVLDFLLEHSVAVTDSTAISHVAQCRERIQEAGGQTAQTAVAQRCIGLLILKHVQVHAHLAQGFLYLPVSAQINEVVAQCASHQEFHGHIIDHFGIVLLELLLAGHPVIDDDVLGCICNCLKQLLL